MNVYIEDVSVEKTGRVLDIIKNHVKRTHNVNVYVQKGMTPIDKNGSIVYGAMFFINDGEKAFRLNWKTHSQSAHIYSIDFWTGINSDPHLSADTSTLSLPQIIKLIDEVLSQPKPGVIEISEEIVNTSIWKKYESFLESKEKEKKTVYVSKASQESLIVDKKSKKIFDDIFNSPMTAKEVFEYLEEVVNSVKSGKSKAALIVGDPGIGKTYAVKKLLKGTNHEFFTGAITSASALYKILFVNNDPNKIIVFDDLDNLFDDQECVNILKGALDTGERTEISYISNNTISPLLYQVIKEYEYVDDIPMKIVKELEEQKVDVESISPSTWNAMRNLAASPSKASAILPNKFTIKSRVIFISNKYLHEIPSSLVSRSLVVEVSLSLNEIIKRIEETIDHIEIEGATEQHKREALKFLKEKVAAIKVVKKIDFRTFMDIVKFVMTGAPRSIWERWAAQSVMLKYGNETMRKQKRR